MRLPIDLHRFRGLASIAFGLALLLALLNSFLILSTGTSPQWLVPQHEPKLWQVDARNALARRIKGVLSSLPSDEKAAGGRVVTYFGMSTGIEGIDANLLAKLSGYPGRIVGLCSSGGSIPFLVEPIHLVSKWGLRSALNLIFIHPSWLVGNPVASSKTGLSRLNWAERNGLYANFALQTFLYEQRVRFALFAADPKPWRGQRTKGHPPHRSKEFIESLRNKLTEQGWFDPEFYRRYQESRIELLMTAMKELRELGSPVVLALMPETTEIRNRVPPEAGDFVKSTVRNELGPDTIVWDFRDSIKDDRFTDLYHLNKTGRQEFTLLLARTLKTTFPSLFAPSGPIKSAIREEQD